MSLTTIFCQKLLRNTFSILLFFLFFSETSVAQCAGSDASITICDIQSQASQNVDLFVLLGAGAQPGGSWSNPSQTLGFNVTTGILNAWKIRLAGTYTFTYTVNDPLCVDNSSTVTVIIGGFAGVPSTGSAACDDDTNFNLFQSFNGTDFPSPQFGGLWTDLNNTGAVSGNFLNATLTGIGTFSFKYSIPATGSCPISEQTIFITVYPAPKPGSPSILNFCENDDFSTLTNVDLLDHLTGQDPGGLWDEGAETSELNGISDTVIDIQNIFNTNGPGIYNFSYTVLPNNPVCLPKTATIVLNIEEIIDLTGGTVVVASDICENEIPTATYTVTVTQGVKPIADDVYQLTYAINGPNSVPLNVASVQFTAGVGTFALYPPSFDQVGTYTITITGIKKFTATGNCDNIAGISGMVTIHPLPNLDNAVLDIDPVCANSPGTVSISGMSPLTPGNYQITYTIVGANQAIAQTVDFVVTGSDFSFVIPASLLPNPGNTTITITKIVNMDTGCENSVNIPKNFTVRPLPDLSNLSLSVTNSCQNQPLTVSVLGLGTMTSVSVLYNLSGANTATAQAAAFTASGGSGSFQVPAALLINPGQTQIAITVLVNTITTCASPANTDASFTVNALPDVTNVSVIVDDVCQNQTASVLVSGLDATPSVSITYSLSVANTATQTTIVSPSAGSAVFAIPANLLPNTGVTVVAITAVGNTLTNCPGPTSVQDSFTINPVPNAATINVNIPDVCQNQPVSVLFSNLGSISSLTFTYNLSNANTASNQTQTIAVSGGSATYVLPASLVPNTGATVMTLTNLSNPVTNCGTTTSIVASFTINPLPNPLTLSVVVADSCQNQPVSALISGLGNATSGTVTYDLSGANSSTGQTASITISGGNAIFVIPTVLLPNTGNTTLTITNLTFAQGNCSTSVTTASDIFTIITLPIAPIVANMVFCKAQNATISNLIPNGAQYNWYDSANATTPLALDVPLVAGDYFVSETNPATNCSSPRTMINVSISELAQPVLNTDGENFCGANNPTLQDLTDNTTVDEDVVWYDAPQNGNALPDTQLLQQGVTYYGFQFSTTVGCVSETFLAVQVSLTNCDDDDDDDFFIPDGFSPNGDTVNETFKIPDIEFLYPDFSIEIYNRYGNLIFKGNKSKPAWDGYNSQSGNVINGIAPNGVYFYVIHFNKNNKSPKQGRLYLNR